MNFRHERPSLLNQQALLESRQIEIAESCRTLGLNATNTILFGTAGLALHGLHASLSKRSGFDIDAFVDAPTLQRLKETYPPINSEWSSTTISIDSGVIPLPFSGFNCVRFDPDDIHTHSFADALPESVIVGELSTLPIERLAQLKIDAGRKKDRKGIEQAFILARTTEMPEAFNLLAALSMTEAEADATLMETSLPAEFSTSRLMGGLLSSGPGRRLFRPYPVNQ